MQDNSENGVVRPPRRACCHLCGSSKGNEENGTAVRWCSECGTCYHFHDCGNKYKSKVWHLSAPQPPQ
ncbi:hypothetical protein CYMTET_19031 [Cymbomonas tetramitiformis]|uniref:Uncharacterized protein n=1 Tax=Cymbomonas tetramitiformis TaxID=36881 RepID=A0AAE0G7D7_9CHLO|nr:hypothetical protein CYMTET_19031 [Cymbomonas tetramitiformis]